MQCPSKYGIYTKGKVLANQTKCVLFINTKLLFLPQSPNDTTLFCCLRPPWFQEHKKLKLKGIQVLQAFFRGLLSLQNHCVSKFESSSNRATHWSIEMLVYHIITNPGYHNATSLRTKVSQTLGTISTTPPPTQQSGCGAALECFLQPTGFLLVAFLQLSSPPLYSSLRMDQKL